MSGWKTNLMAQASRQYIEGYCNVANSTLTFELTYSNDYVTPGLQTITVNTDSNGYWRYYTDGYYISSYSYMFSHISQAEADKLVSVRFSDNWKIYKGAYSTTYSTFGQYANNQTGTFACTNLKSVMGWKVKSSGFHSLCRLCTSLEEFDTSGLQQRAVGNITMSYMFNNTKIKRLEFRYPMQTSSISNICSQNRDDLTYVDLSKVDLSICTNLSGAFSGCYYLEDVIWNKTSSLSSAAINFNSLFRDCFSLKYNSLNCLNVSGTTASSVNYMYGCNSTPAYNNYQADTGNIPFYQLNVISIPNMPNGIDTSSAIARYNTRITEIISCGDIANDISLSYCGLLTRDSVELVISKLQDVTSYGGCHIAFHNTILNMIRNDAALSAMVTAKRAIGWIFDNL